MEAHGGVVGGHYTRCDHREDSSRRVMVAKPTLGFESAL